MFNGTLDANVLDNFALDGPGGKAVKSYQYGSFSYTAGLTSANATISAVTMENSLLEFRVGPIAEARADKSMLKGNIASNTTINFQSSVAATSDITAYWQVLEYESLKSRQYGTITITSGVTEGDQAVTEFDTSNAFFYCSYYPTFTSSTTVYYALLYGRIDTSINLKFRGLTNGNVVYDWQLLEFK